MDYGVLSILYTHLLLGAASSHSFVFYHFVQTVPLLFLQVRHKLRAQKITIS